MNQRNDFNCAVRYLKNDCNVEFFPESGMNLPQKTFVIKMLRDRGNLSSVKDFAHKIIVGNVVAYFEKNSKIKRDFVKKIIGELSDDIELVIIVHGQSITAEANNALATSTIAFQTWTFDEMAFDLSLIVPSHSLVEGDKPKDWKKFPIISSRDVVARYYGFVRDDIVRIAENGTVTYRRCC